jgi:hypothetical protein
MHLSLKIASINMELTTIYPDENKSTRGQQLYFTVYPDDRDHLDLETGEVFENPRYAKLRKHLDKLISAQLSVREASSAEDVKYNRMQYLGEVKGDDYGSEASIYFQYFLHPRYFHSLVSSIQSGILPTTVHIELPFSLRDDAGPIKFGWEPDGSGQEWRNKADENKAVEIESIGFRYEILKEARDSNTGELLEPENVSPVEIANTFRNELKDQLTAVQTQIKHLGWIILAAAILIVFYLAR